MNNLISANHYFQSAIMPTVFIYKFCAMLLMRFAVIIMPLGDSDRSDEITFRVTSRDSVSML